MTEPDDIKQPIDEQPDDQTALVRVESGKVSLDSRQLRVLKNALNLQASDAELLWIGEYCSAMGLNPFMGHVHFWKDKGRIVPFIGIPAWYKRMYEHPMFERGFGPQFAGTDGEWADFWVPQKDQALPYMGRYGIKRRDQEDVIYEISYFKEKFQPGKPAWMQNPLSMFGDRCVGSACRRILADSFGGLYMEGELPVAEEQAQQVRNSMAMSEFKADEAAKAAEPEVMDAEFEEVADAGTDIPAADSGSDDSGGAAGGVGDESGVEEFQVPSDEELAKWNKEHGGDIESDVRGKTALFEVEDEQ